MENFFIDNLEKACKDGLIEEKYCQILKSFYFNYIEKVSDKIFIEDLFKTLLKLTIEQFQTPFKFDNYHKKIEKPFNYYKFGTDFLSPLIEKKSNALKEENIKQIEKIIDKKENVVLFANHQIEPDPLAISILLNKKNSSLAKKIIYVAGERVLVDPLARIFSMGCDILSIYSKKYIDIPIEKKREKQLHNKKTMRKMLHLLNEGGKIIFVAPSGGRDRRDPQTHDIKIAPFDYQSIEMFLLMGSKSTKKTHFFPLSLYTYDLMPPPETTQIELGEKRKTNKGNIYAFFGKEIFLDQFEDIKDKIIKRKEKTKYIQNLVQEGYDKIKDME